MNISDSCRIMLNSSIASILLLSISSCVFKKCYVYGNNKLDKYNFISQHDDGSSVKINAEYLKGIFYVVKCKDI